MTSTFETEALEAWFRSYGGYLHPSISILQDSSSGIHYRATAPVSTATQIASAPHSLALSYLNALVDDDFPVFREQKHRFKVEALGFFYLMAQYIHRETSFWKPYLNTLPKPEEDFVQPLFFEDTDDIAWLNGTDVWHNAVVREEVYERYYRDGITALREAGVGVEPYTWHLFKWAIAIFSSRSFVSRALYPHGGSKFWPAHRSPNPSGCREEVLLDMSSVPDEDLEFPVLFPGLDAANHSHNAKVDWTFDQNCFSITTAGKESVETGSEVFNNYGPKGNAELLLGYGFSIPNNPHDNVAMTLKTPPQSLQAELSRVHPEHFTDNGHWSAEKATYYLNRPQHATDHGQNDGDQAIEKILQCLPEALLELLIYILRHERGLPFTAIDKPLEYLTSPNSPGRRYLPHLARMIVQSLAPKLSKLHSTDLPSEPQNNKQKQAAIYRQGQIDVLSSLMSALRAYTPSLIWQSSPSNTLTKPESPRLMTLESFLAHLSHNRPSIANNFLQGIEANANTRDVTQLRLAGWEEDVWVLLLCYLLFPPMILSEQCLPEYISSSPLGGHAIDATALEQATSLMPLIRTAAAACPHDQGWAELRWTSEFIAGAGGKMLQFESFVVMMSDEEGDEEARLCMLF